MIPQSMTTRQRVATAVVHDEKTNRDVTLTHRELKEALENRLPMLQAAFKREMEAAGVAFISMAEEVSL
jgi:hypothetical protein